MLSYRPDGEKEKEMLSAKIIIETRGGLVESVFSNIPDTDVLLIDHDIESCDEEELQAYNELCDEADQWKPDMTEVY
jgi:hypothetical protein